MGSITVGRYDDTVSTGYQGWTEPEDRPSWIMFVRPRLSPPVQPRR